MSMLESLEISGKRVFLRCDLNVPLKDGAIVDDGRIRASLPTIKFLLNGGASLVIGAHLGRPKGVIAGEFSLAPVAERLRVLLERDVEFIGGVKPNVVANSIGGHIQLLENLRFNPAETSKVDDERRALAKEIAKYVECYVGDGFGAVHRKHASVYDLPRLLPHAPGFLVSAEVEVLKKLTQNPVRPYGVILGGSKVSDKIGVIANLLDKVDVLAIGGGMVFTFLAAQGKSIGKSLVEKDLIPTVQELMERASSMGVDLRLPTDIVVAPEFSADSPATIVSTDEIAQNMIGLDIGPDSAKDFAMAIAPCKTVFWNGPMGVFEFPAFAHGTRIVAKALADLSGICVIGGGDSAAAVRSFGFKDSDFGYISTGGGASLEYLEGKDLPGLKALDL